jgi:hypothetical protein
MLAVIKDEPDAKSVNKEFSLLMNFTEKSSEKFVKRQIKKEKA